MNYRQRTLQILIALVFGVLLYLHFWDSIFSQNADLAHHYALVARLAEFGDLPRVVDPSLGEMQIYPRLSHRFAAVLGGFWGSPLAGMQIVLLLSMSALWAAIGWMLWSQPSRQARRSTQVALLALVIGGFFLDVDLWGHEVVGSYFYAQFVAQAAVLVILAISLSLSQAGWSRFAIYGLLIVGIFVVELMHLLPALELLGFLGLLVAFDQLWQARRWDARTLFARAAFAVAALLVVVLNPVFRTMATISENNGSLPLTFIPNHFALQALVLITIASSVVGMRYWIRLKDPERQREQLVIKYFAILGLSISTLCFLQMVVLEIGSGSEYACRKYAFGLWTVLIVNVSLLMGCHSGSNGESSSTVRSIRTIFDYGAVGLLMVVAALAIFPRHKSVSLAHLMSLERQMEAVKVREPAIPVGTSTYVLQLPGESPVIDYMFSVGVFKSERSDNTLDILYGRDLSQLNKIGMVITVKDKSRYDMPACRLPSADPVYAFIDGMCYAKTIATRDTCHGEMSLTNSHFSQGITEGFASPEDQGTWTNAKVATFHCEMPDRGAEYPNSVRISGFAFVPATHVQHVSISVNGGDAQEFVFDSGKPEQSIVLAVPKGASGIRIKFLLPDAVSPKAMGLSTDPRVLGFYLKSIQVLKTDGRPI
ncbi:hypothetical protein [Paraburkholderia nodosa]|uniref:hypothetical protein n=1 Tax=Paraburkholderia nodosa TaxID=392320 RepID=UPI000480FC61|nr:hypothetical protein [Paraburkholderia nodosa]